MADVTAALESTDLGVPGSLEDLEGRQHQLYLEDLEDPDDLWDRRGRPHLEPDRETGRRTRVIFYRIKYRHSHIVERN